MDHCALAVPSLIRAVEGLITPAFPLVVLLFATTYFVMDQYQAHSFTQGMTRVDSLYFTVTTFATVGYGDITPVTESARLTAVLQMVVDLVLIGLVARAFVNSVRTGLAHETTPPLVKPSVRCRRHAAASPLNAMCFALSRGLFSLAGQERPKVLCCGVYAQLPAGSGGQRNPRPMFRSAETPPRRRPA